MSTPGLSPATVIGTAGTNQVSTVTITGAPGGGTFDVTVGVDTASANVYNITAANLQTAILALGGVGAGNATVARAGAGTAPSPYVYTITFKAALAATAITVTADGSSLTGGTTPAAVAATPTPGVARASGTAIVGGRSGYVVSLVPDSEAVGSVLIYGSIDETNYALLDTVVLTASTPVLAHFDRIPIKQLKVDTTALTAGQCPATYAVYHGV